MQGLLNNLNSPVNDTISFLAGPPPNPESLTKGGLTVGRFVLPQRWVYGFEPCVELLNFVL